MTASLFITSLYDELGLIINSALNLVIKLDCGVLAIVTSVPVLYQIVTTPPSNLSPLFVVSTSAASIAAASGADLEQLL